jgi:hypothetical protein
MRKEEIDVLAKLLSEMKDTLGDLESSVKKNDLAKINASKRRILDLQMQINKRI